ncbi:hypothetical protein [Kitasatospora sp. NPDC088351]|uniref:hypothetical protein n=1 Tax=Kitasatospora sp. NPDC088351 TaxID=3155180 RepID=UPI003422E8A7
MTDSATPHDNAATPADAPPVAPVAPPAPVAPVVPPAAEVNVWSAPEAPLLPPPPAETPEERAARRTRRRKAALRWSAAVLVLALAGTGAAAAVTAPDRTDLPGLATESDGRYTFPALALPPLPSGKAAPSAKESKGRHAADLRHLLLPVPKEAGGSLAPVVFPTPTASAGSSAGADATASPSASPSGTAAPSASPSAGGTATTAAPSAGPAVADWVACDAAAADQLDPARTRALLLQDACRAATVREWTASDGTRTQIRLLRFGSSPEAWDVFADLRSNGEWKDLPGLKTGSAQGWDDVSGVDRTIRESPVITTKSRTNGYLAYLNAGDVVGIVVMTNPTDGVPEAAFRQVVTLQSDLLG